MLANSGIARGRAEPELQLFIEFPPLAAEGDDGPVALAGSQTSLLRESRMA